MSTSTPVNSSAPGSVAASTDTAIFTVTGNFWPFCRGTGHSAGALYHGATVTRWWAFRLSRDGPADPEPLEFVPALRPTIMLPDCGHRPQKQANGSQRLDDRFSAQSICGARGKQDVVDNRLGSPPIVRRTTSAPLEPHQPSQAGCQQRERAGFGHGRQGAE